MPRAENKPDKNRSPEAICGSAMRKSPDGATALITVRVQPRASKKGIEGVKDGALRVKLTAPPTEGEANAQLIEVLSKEFGTRKSSMRIVKGHSSRDKLVEVDLA